MSLDLEWTDKQLEEVKLDKRKVLSIARRLNKISKEMRELNLSIYSCSGTGFLIHYSQPTHINGGQVNPRAILVNVGQGFDGGDL